MVRIRSLLVALAICTQTGALAVAQDLPSLAVFPVVTTESARQQVDRQRLDTQELVRQIEETIRATRRFSIFERSGEILRNSVRAEQEFAQGGQAIANAAQAGKLANVQFIVQPLITQASVSVARRQREDIPGQYSYKAAGSIVVSLKVLDTTSGEIMYQATRETALPTPNSVGGQQAGTDDETIVRAAAWRALTASIAGRLGNAVVGALFPLQVIQKQGDDIFVNRGEGAGIAVGDTYQLFATGEALVDPISKEKLGNAEKLLGDVQIIRVNPRFSVARALKPLEEAVKSGDILRPLP